MKFKKIGPTVMSILLLLALANSEIVNADDDYEEYEDYDDHDRDHDKYKKKYDDDDHKYEKDDDDDDERGDYNYETTPVVNSPTWNLWTRTTVVNKGELPINTSTQVQIKVENADEELSLYMIPLDGELFVPGKSVAEFLGAKANYYKASKILEVTANSDELLFRAGTNVVYDNQQKTPLPATAFYMNNELFIPISVITNGLGYIAEWQEGTNEIICKKIAF